MSGEVFPAGTEVEIMEYGEWIGPFTVTAHTGRTPDHLVLLNPKNGVLFESYNDAPYNTRKKEEA